MGETGCGKTRLIRYMCGLQTGPGGPRNMLLAKVSSSWTECRMNFESYFVRRKMYRLLLPYMCAESLLVERYPFCQSLENNLIYSYRLSLELSYGFTKDFASSYLKSWLFWLLSRFMAVRHTKILSWKYTRRKKWLVKTKKRTLTQFCSSMRPTPLRHWAWSRRSWWTAESMEDLLDRVWRDCSLSLLVILTEGDYNAICCTIKFEVVWHEAQFVWEHEKQIKPYPFFLSNQDCLDLSITPWYQGICC